MHQIREPKEPMYPVPKAILGQPRTHDSYLACESCAFWCFALEKAQHHADRKGHTLRRKPFDFNVQLPFRA